MTAPLCNRCQKPIKFELLKGSDDKPIPKVDETGEPIIKRDGTPAYKMKPVNLDGSKHDCDAGVFTGKPKEEKPAAPTPTPSTQPVTGTNNVIALLEIDNIISAALKLKALLGAHQP